MRSPAPLGAAPSHHLADRINSSAMGNTAGSHFWGGFAAGAVASSVLLVIGVGIYLVTRRLEARRQAKRPVPAVSQWDSSVRRVTRIEPETVPESWQRHIPLLEDAGDAVARILATSAYYSRTSSSQDPSA